MRALEAVPSPTPDRTPSAAPPAWGRGPPPRASGTRRRRPTAAPGCGGPSRAGPRRRRPRAAGADSPSLSCRPATGSSPVSAMHSAAPWPRRASKTSSSNHDACRNSTAIRRRSGISPRKLRSRETSFLKFGGSWNKSGPSRGPRVEVTPNRYVSSSPQSLSRRSWVIRLDALITNMKLSGTCSAQPFSNASWASDRRCC